MGKMNVLKAGVIGKLGETYGSKGFGKTILKAVPKTKATHTQTQTDALINFGCLQRFCSPIAKHFFKNMGLQERDMTKLNAVAKRMKDMMLNKEFSLSNISVIAKKQGGIEISEIHFDQTEMKVSAFISNENLEPYQQFANTFIGIYSENGECYGSLVVEELDKEIEIQLEKNLLDNIYLVGFRTYKDFGKTKFVDGFSMLII